MAEKQFKYLEFKVGLFILVAVIISIFIVAYLAVQKNIFTKKIKVQVIADSGEGLVKGMPVVYSGFQIAKVDDLYLRDDGKVVMKIKIPIRYAKWIRKDTEVKLSSKSIIGSGELIFTGGHGEEIEDGYVFKLKRDRKIEQLIEEAKPMLEDVKKLMKNLVEITTALNKMTPDWQRISKGLGDVGEDLSEKRGSIGVLARTNYLTEKMDYLFAKVDKLDKKVNSILSKVEDRIEQTKDTINYTNELLLSSKQLLKNSNKLVLNIDDKLTKSEDLIVESSKLVKNLRLLTDNTQLYLDEVDYLLANTNLMILNMQKRWPFNPKETDVDIKNYRLDLP